MLSMFQAMGYAFKHVTGVTNKETGEVVAQSSDEALALLNRLYGINLNVQQLSNYYTLHDAIKGHPQYDNVMKIYLKILESTRADIPDDLQKYWLAHKDEYGLTGKFLPDNSNLRKYI